MHVGINGMLLWGAFSGVETAIDRLIAALARLDRSNDYTLYVSRDYSGTAPQQPNWRLARAPVFARNRLARIAWEQCCLPRLATRQKLDLLHAPGYILPWRCKTPVVVSVYDLFALTCRSLSRPQNAWYYGLALPPSLRRASTIIVPSAYVRDEIVTHLQIQAYRLKVIPLGVESRYHPVGDPAIRGAVRSEYDLPDRYLLFVGNLEPKKNLPRLLRAFASARRKLPDLHLVIAGKPAWERHNLPQLAADLGVGNRVHFTGYVPVADLPALYSMAEAFVFPSLCEGFGLPPLEAMACGTPVIASRTTALGETLGAAARLVDPESEESIAEGIVDLTTFEDQRDALVQSGLQHARRFTWERTARETIRVYEQTVNQGEAT